VGVEALKQIETAQWHPLATRKGSRAEPHGHRRRRSHANFENYACLAPQLPGYCNEQPEQVMAFGRRS
jgi:hypothetical protein